jgi:hypothetical protein
LQNARVLKKPRLTEVTFTAGALVLFGLAYFIGGTADIDGKELTVTGAAAAAAGGLHSVATPLPGMSVNVNVHPPATGMCGLACVISRTVFHQHRRRFPLQATGCCTLTSR